MSNLTLKAIPFLAKLQEKACKISRRGEATVRYRFRREDFSEDLDILGLVGVGAHVRIYSGRGIWDVNENTMRRTSVLRGWTTVEVTL